MDSSKKGYFVDFSRRKNIKNNISEIANALKISGFPHPLSAAVLSAYKKAKLVVV